MKFRASYIWAVLVALGVIGWMASGSFTNSNDDASPAAPDVTVVDTDTAASSTAGDAGGGTPRISAVAVENAQIRRSIRASGITAPHAIFTISAEIRGVPPPASLDAPDAAAAVSPAVTSGAVDDASSALFVKLPDAIQPITPSATSTAQIYEARIFICPSPVNFSVTALSGRWAIYSRSKHTRQAFWHIAHAQVRHRATAHCRTAFLGIRGL